MSEKRPYQLKKRAKSREETRQKIIDATMQLHEEIGPRATTISAIAERAGVQRLTVYHHFPDETAVFEACTSHWLNLNPPPDPALWDGLDDPLASLATALGHFYDYYGSTRRMWAAATRDVADVPALQGPMAEFSSYVAAVATDIVAAFPDSWDAPFVNATVFHAFLFQTWASLQDQNLPNAAKVALVIRWLEN